MALINIRKLIVWIQISWYLVLTKHLHVPTISFTCLESTDFFHTINGETERG